MGGNFSFYFSKFTQQRLLLKHPTILFFSGRAPDSLTLEKLQTEGYGPQNPFPITHGYSVTVPGAAAAWVDAFNKFGSKKVRFTTVVMCEIQSKL